MDTMILHFLHFGWAGLILQGKVTDWSLFIHHILFFIDTMSSSESGIE